MGGIENKKKKEVLLSRPVLSCLQTTWAMEPGIKLWTDADQLKDCAQERQEHDVVHRVEPMRRTRHTLSSSARSGTNREGNGPKKREQKGRER